MSKENGKLYLNTKFESKIFYTNEARALLCSLCLLYKVMVEWQPPHLSDLPYPRGRSYTLCFSIKMTTKDAQQVVENNFV